jgi:Putative zinc-finger
MDFMRKRNVSECPDLLIGGYAMDHAEAVGMKAAERYLLGELSFRDHEAFEEHFFECPECAEDVRLGFQFRDNVKAVFSEDPQPVWRPERSSRRRTWFDWMRPLMLMPAACLMLVGVIGYQNLVTIPQLRSSPASISQPEAVPSAVLAPSSRGEAPAIFVPAGAHSFHLQLDLRPIGQFEKYACELRSSSGASLWKVPIDTLDPAAGLHLLAPAKAFPPGSYDAVLMGAGQGNNVEIDHYRFDIRRP